MKKIIIAFVCMMIASLVNAEKKLPNIVLFLLDDVGIGNLNCYGSPKDIVQTPYMDSLAESGIRFTNALTTSSVCAPTRYAIMTGRYAWRGLMKHDVVGNAPMIIEGVLTIPEMLKEKGYQTACIGKWHLGFTRKTHWTIDFREPLRPGPLDVGFDYFFGIANNHGDSTGVWLENDGIWKLRSKNIIDVPRGYVGTKMMGFDAPQRVDEEASQMCTDKAIEWMDSIDKSKPFFLYFPSPIAHEPITPSKKRAGTSKGGIYCDFLMDGDDSVGQIIDYLKKHNVYDNTLFILTSDNGTNALWGYNRNDERWTKSDRFKDGHPLMNAIDDATNAGLRPNADLKDGKTSVYEGGFRVPFIVRWPGNVPEGVVNDTAFSVVDILATLADVVDYKYTRGEWAAPDSVSLIDLWKNKEFDRPNIITHAAGGTFAIRNKDGVKYIEGKPFPDQKNIRPGENQKHIYKLSGDIAEEKNLIKEEEELAKELQESLDFIRDTNMTRLPSKSKK